VENGTKAIPVLRSEEHSAEFDEEGNLLIADAEDWETFCYVIDKGRTNIGAKLTEDVVLTAQSSMAGRDGGKFSGIFDGCGHTLTLNYVASEEHAAPFRFVDGARIMRLTTDGTVTTSRKYGSGLVGDSVGSVYIANCNSAVTINSTVEGDGTHGGLIATASSGSVYFRDCEFTGSMLGEDTNCCGGFIGWRNSASVYYYNCLFAPAEMTVSSEGSATFHRNSSSISGSNNWYRQAFGATVQGSNGTGKTAAELKNSLGVCWTAEDDELLLDTEHVNIANGSFSGLNGYYPVTGAAIEPKPTVTVNGITLTEGKDFNYRYENNVAVGTARVTAVAADTGIYVGSFYSEFRVEAIEGECGSGLTWSYDLDSKILTIAYTEGEGTTGAMEEFGYNNAPWHNYQGECTAVVLPEGLTSIGSYAFYNFDRLTGITIPDGVTSIGSNAFSDCDSLANVTIPDGVTSIGSSAFYYCGGLKSVTIPASVTSIGGSAFYNAYNLKDVYLEHTLNAPTVENNTFIYVTSNLWIKTEAVFDGVYGAFGGGTWTLRSNSINDLSDGRIAVIGGVIGAYEETGEAIIPVPTVTLFGTVLTEGVDYTVRYGANVSGTGSVTITGIGDYSGVQTKTFMILGSTVSYLDENGETRSRAVSDCTVYDGRNALTDGWYLMCGDTANRRVTVTGDVKIILMDGVTQRIPKGITVNEGNTLTIYAQSAVDETGGVAAEQQSCGKLIVDGVETCYAGIGGTTYTSYGTIIINGGVIEATGGKHVNWNDSGAGIGGGYVSGNGTVTINGGYVRAIGGQTAAGIGSGDESSSYNGGTITINGGIVHAIGGYAAGIGAGNSAGDVGTVTINGGYVTAEGSYSGIGVGSNTYKNGTVTINGGVVNAVRLYSSSSYPGIGGSNVTVTLGWTEATDSISATSYKGTVSFAEGKEFRYADSGEEVTLPIADGKTIVPYMGMTVTGPNDVSVTAGEDAEFTVTVTGGYGQRSYQWKQYDAAEGAWFDLEDETGATLTISEVTVEQNGAKYVCVVTDGSGSVTSGEAVLAVAAAPAVIFEITEQPVDYEGEIGDEVSFTVAATGEGLSYQWQYSSDGGATWKASGLPGNATATLTTQLTETRLVYRFRCVVTDANGGTVTSDIVRMRR
jgi:hypothetical protein